MRTKILVMTATVTVASIAHSGEIQFTNAPIPTNDLDKRSVLTSQFALVDGAKTDIDYNTLMRSGDQPGASHVPFGTILDIEGEPVINEDGSVKVSNDNDFASLLQGGGHRHHHRWGWGGHSAPRGGELFMVSHFETRPAAMYLTKLDQNGVTGKLTPVATRPLDFSHVNGGWVHCAGMVSPWGTHIGSEEYPPNGKQWRDATVDSYNAEMVRYFPPARGAADADLPDLALDYMNPYDYGFVIEVDVENYFQADVMKHYSMGRVAIELPYVMPNEKTVYISDDGSRVGLFRYEADVPGDLSSGTLYAAKWIQTSPYYTTQTNVETADRDGGGAIIDWVELGHATDDEVRDIIDSGVTFEDIFEEDVPGCVELSNRDASSECLLLNPGMDKAAAFLESSRYAEYIGATMEFEKMEGITLDPSTNTMYLSMSRVRTQMTDGEGDISVPYNYCGTVYSLNLDDDYVAYSMQGAVAGIPRLISRGATVDDPYPADGPLAANQCDLNGISEPDNVTFIPGYDTLVIGEDTGLHQNDVIWAYNLDSKELTRLQTTPYGSETTSPYVYPNLNGFGYVVSVIQHPFGESDEDQLMDDSEALGYTGYLGPFPALTQ